MAKKKKEAPKKKEATPEKETPRSKNKNFLLILAGLFIGIGVGFAIDRIPAGTLVGLGVGCLAAFIASFRRKK